MPVAGRVVFQMDQATSSYQILLRYFRERGQNSSVDRSLDLPAGSYRQKRLNLSTSLYEMLQILSLTMFERIRLDQLLNNFVTDEIHAVV